MTTLPMLSKELEDKKIKNPSIEGYSQVQQQCIIDIKESIEHAKEKVQKRLTNGALTNRVTNGLTKQIHERHQDQDEKFINRLTGYLEELTSKRMTIKQLRNLEYSWLFNSPTIVYFY